jgi:hypothetical protein
MIVSLLENCQADSIKEYPESSHCQNENNEKTWPSYSPGEILPGGVVVTDIEGD